MWVKICGNTNLEDSLMAAAAGADALGFVFAPSSRQVKADLVGRITAKLPAEVEKVGVFVNASFEEISSTVETAGLTGIQLHRSDDPHLPLKLRERIAGRPGQFRILSVISYNDPAAVEEKLTDLREDDAIDGVLVDTFSPKAAGGTGETFPWESARRAFLKVAPDLRLVVAGGLKPDTVAQAIQTLRPWGVDVVSGVESAPGRKDSSKVAAFVSAARQAASRESLAGQVGRTS